VKRQHSVTDPAFYSVAIWVSFPEIKRSHFHIVLGLSLSGTLPPLPNAFVACAVNFTLLMHLLEDRCN